MQSVTWAATWISRSCAWCAGALDRQAVAGQGRTVGVKRLAGEGDVSVLQAEEEETGKRPKPRRAMAVSCASLILAATNIRAGGGGAAGRVRDSRRALHRPAEAYRDIDWRVVILIGCMLALGPATVKTAIWLAGRGAATDAGSTGHHPLAGAIRRTRGE